MFCENIETFSKNSKNHYHKKIKHCSITWTRLLVFQSIVQ